MLAALDASRKRVEERQAEIPGRLRNFRNRSSRSSAGPKTA